MSPTSPAVPADDVLDVAAFQDAAPRPTTRAQRSLRRLAA